MSLGPSRDEGGKEAAAAVAATATAAAAAANTAVDNAPEPQRNDPGAEGRYGRSEAHVVGEDRWTHGEENAYRIVLTKVGLVEACRCDGRLHQCPLLRQPRMSSAWASTSHTRVLRLIVTDTFSVGGCQSFDLPRLRFRVCLLREGAKRQSFPIFLPNVRHVLLL